MNWDLFRSLAGFGEDTVVDNIDEEYDRLFEYLYVALIELRVSKSPRDVFLQKHSSSSANVESHEPQVIDL